MFKNVRALIALIAVVVYCALTGYEVWNSKVVPQHFYVFVAGVGAYYFYTKTKEEVATIAAISNNQSK